MAQYKLKSGFDAMTPTTMGQYGADLIMTVPKGTIIQGTITDVPKGYKFTKGIFYKKRFGNDIWIDEKYLELIPEKKGSVAKDITKGTVFDDKTTAKKQEVEQAEEAKVDDEMMGGTAAEEKKILGMKPMVFWIVVISALVVIGGGTLFIFRKKIF